MRAVQMHTVSILATLALAITPRPAPAAVYRVLINFVGTPTGGLAVDNSGVLYGYTFTGGGSIYKFDPSTKVMTTLFNAQGHKDGSDPVGSPALAANGDLFGVMSVGGAGCGGGIFKLNAKTGLLRTISDFPVCNAGRLTSGVVIDNKQNIYGVTESDSGSGNIVYRIDGKTGDFTVLHTFSGGSGDTYGGATLLLRNGLLYGAMCAGGTSGKGNVFTIDPNTGAMTTVYSFAGGADGECPTTNLVADKAGNLYGGQLGAAGSQSSAVFKLSRAVTSAYTIYNFNTADGSGPVALSINPSNNLLIGLLPYNGNSDSPTLFQLNPNTVKFTSLECCGNPGVGDGVYVAHGKAFYGVEAVDNGGGQKNNGIIFKYIQ